MLMKNTARRRAVWAALSTTLLWAGTAAHGADPREIFSQVRLSVLPLEMRDANGNPTGTHTAIVVAPRQVISACDVLDGGFKPFVVSATGPLQANTKARDPQRNLCLLDVPALEAPAASLIAANAMPTAGARVYAVSNALGLGVGISEGVVAGIREVADRRYIQFSAPISPGSEGGALVNDAGQVVGVIDYRRRDGQNVNFAAPAQWITEVEARNTDDSARRRFFARATDLVRDKKWAELMTLALEWNAKQSDDIDAHRLVAFTARMQNDLDSEEKAWREMRRIDPAMVFMSDWFRPPNSDLIRPKG